MRVEEPAAERTAGAVRPGGGRTQAGALLLQPRFLRKLGETLQMQRMHQLQRAQRYAKRLGLGRWSWSLTQPCSAEKADEAKPAKAAAPLSAPLTREQEEQQEEESGRPSPVPSLVVVTRAGPVEVGSKRAMPMEMVATSECEGAGAGRASAVPGYPVRRGPGRGAAVPAPQASP